MKISKQARRDAKTLFRGCVVDGILQEDRVRKVVQSVIDAKPRGYIAILHHFQRLVRADIQNRTAKVESPAALDAGTRENVQTQLKAQYGDHIQITFAENPALIGGMRVQVGSFVYDGSVRGRLNQIGKAFAGA